MTSSPSSHALTVWNTWHVGIVNLDNKNIIKEKGEGGKRGDKENKKEKGGYRRTEEKK